MVRQTVAVLFLFFPHLLTSHIPLFTHTHTPIGDLILVSGDRGPVGAVSCVGFHNDDGAFKLQCIAWHCWWTNKTSISVIFLLKKVLLFVGMNFVLLRFEKLFMWRRIHSGFFSNFCLCEQKINISNRIKSHAIAMTSSNCADGYFFHLWKSYRITFSHNLNKVLRNFIWFDLFRFQKIQMGFFPLSLSEFWPGNLTNANFPFIKTI